MKLQSLFSNPKYLIGMVHLAALPGTPRAELAPTAILDQALQEAQLLAEAGFDALIIENMHDRPYLKTAQPETIAHMAVISRAIKQQCQIPIGVQVLAGANQAALAVAHAADADFVRVEGFVFGHIADEGYIESCAGELLRYRKHIGAEHIAVIADIKKKHSAHAITADVNIAETAKAAEFFLVDGVIVTGTSTATPAAIEDLANVRSTSQQPLLIGSGLTPDNLADYIAHADGFIIGSAYKQHGDWSQAINPAAVQRCVNTFKQLTASA